LNVEVWRVRRDGDPEGLGPQRANVNAFHPYDLNTNPALLPDASSLPMQLKKLVPLADRVLVRRVMPVTKTAGGIFIPESNVTKSNDGEVLAVGPGMTTRDGQTIKPPVSVGDMVLLPEYGGLQVKVDGDENIFLFRSEEILAKFAK
jgi:chaperonin GroES